MAYEDLIELLGFTCQALASVLDVFNLILSFGLSVQRRWVTSSAS